MQAYSAPITPAPITASDRGSADRNSNSSESWTRLVWNGNSGGRTGAEPIATRILCPRTYSSPPGGVGRSTRTVCGSKKLPVPWTTVTP